MMQQKTKRNKWRGGNLHVMKGSGRKKGQKPLSLSLTHSAGWRNTAWLATVNTEPATTTTNHRLPGAHTHTHTEHAQPVLLAVSR